MRLGTNHIGPLFSAPLPPPQGSQRPGCQAWFGEIFSSRPRPPLPTPHLLPVLAAAGGPRDLLSDGAAEARGAAPNCLWKQFLLLGLGVCEIFSPVSLPPFSAATSGVLLSRFLILPRGYVCVCVCVTEDGSVLTPLSLTPLLLVREKPTSAEGPSRSGATLPTLASGPPKDPEVGWSVICTREGHNKPNTQMGGWGLGNGVEAQRDLRDMASIQGAQEKAVT